MGKQYYKSLSASALDVYDSCPRYYEGRYIKKLPVKQTGRMIAGSSYHRGIAYALGTVINGLTFSIEEVCDIVSDAWDSLVRKNSVSIEENTILEVKGIDWQDRDPGEYKGRVLDFVKLYIQFQLPQVDAVAVEKKHTRETIPGLFVVGYPDVELRSGAIEENKFAKRRKGQNEVDNEMQPYVYAYLLDRPLVCIYRQALDQKKMDFDIVETKRSSSDIEWVKKKIILTWKLIQTGIFPPQTGSWRCAPDYCDYYVDCRILHLF